MIKRLLIAVFLLSMVTVAGATGNGFIFSDSACTSVPASGICWKTGDGTLYEYNGSTVQQVCTNDASHLCSAYQPAGSYATSTQGSHADTAYGWGNWAHTTLSGYGITDALGLHGKADTCGVADSATGNAGTASALAANGTNCSSGQAPLGVDASGNAEGCFAVIPQVIITNSPYLEQEDK